jgi:SnoaL-like polyketide cyclase
MRATSTDTSSPTTPPTRRHTGDYLGVAPAGRDVSADGITILRFENGKCVERWSVFDFFSLLLQLGAIEPPPAHA